MVTYLHITYDRENPAGIYTKKVDKDKFESEIALEVFLALIESDHFEKQEIIRLVNSMKFFIYDIEK